jgi:predicted transcriptional regulator
MVKSVLISIQPKWCELIASGKKTIEVRKTKPQLDTPFKCYIYCTKASKKSQTVSGRLVFSDAFFSGKVIGEFVCIAIHPVSIEYSLPERKVMPKEYLLTCLTEEQIIDYLGNKKKGYGWHISNLVIYDTPRELSEFYKPCDYMAGKQYADLCNAAGCDYFNCGSCDNVITRPPQSWCYVESDVQWKWGNFYFG